MINPYPKNKKVYIQTWGCQMNVYDTELVQAILAKAEFKLVQSEDEADVVMLNTCAIRENAHRKVYGRIHSIKHNRRKMQDVNGKTNGEVKIGILGCMATNLRTELLENKNLAIDFIAGPDSYKRLPQLIAESFGEGDKPFDLTLSEFETYSDVYPKREKGVNAWIAVMRGCNNFCTFCVVPYTRGRERSRSIANVVDEAKHLVDEGFKQVTLLGQNVNSYQVDDHDFADLLEAVSKVSGIERIRFTSPHPKDFPDKLLKVVAENPKVCKQIHMPLQAGSDRILELMNRTYTQDEFFKLIDKTRALIPNIALSTDIIVGFSSESDEEFEDTLKVMREVQFDSAFMFKYSERKNTIAYKKHEDNVPEAIKTERIVRLNELQKEISLKKNQAHIGTTERVLIESESATKSTDQYAARTDSNKLVIIPPGPYKQGDFVNVTITEATPNVLKGIPVK
ncbi:MAG: tRNA (N6-isopentenyl adenosine(37)-C2)-methylthiotransferase MiaB [Candidatus Omnitrophica bacterium]|nr:tRNA (N6-isopentenyl adenosine(37)-C2)-methylthiotransferase MiaB [Candidatus Omnitrophota bacterium]